MPHHAWRFADYEQQRQKNPISVINPAFADVSQADFQVPDSVQLPTPNASFPAPGNISAPDPSSPIYLQQVSNAMMYNPSLSPDQQIAAFPHQITDLSQFSASDISLVDPHFRFPSAL